MDRKQELYASVSNRLVDIPLRTSYGSFWDNLHSKATLERTCLGSSTDPCIARE